MPRWRLFFFFSGRGRPLFSFPFFFLSRPSRSLYLPSCSPPPIQNQNATLQVVLDLDETLVAAYPEPAPRAPRSWRRGPAQALVVGGVDLGDGRSGDVRCYLRPGLHAFLEGVSEVADVVLFTAGLPGYASPLCDALDPSGSLLPVRLFRQATVAAGGHACVKDLGPLGRDLRRTVLVDNSPFSFLLQPACGLPAHPFDGDGSDDHLLSSVLPLLRELAADPGLDVRPLLSARFGMASWLAARGGWALYEAPCGNLAVATGYCAPAAASGGVTTPPSTPERKKDGFAALAVAAERQEGPRRGEVEEEEFEFEDLSNNSTNSSESSLFCRPSTPTTPLQASEFQQRQRNSGGLKPMGAAPSVGVGVVESEEDERMMPIDVAA